MPNIFEQLKSNLAPTKKSVVDYEDSEHSRYEINRADGDRILIKNIPFLFTCDEAEKLQVYQNRSIIIENGEIIKVGSADPTEWTINHLAGRTKNTRLNHNGWLLNLKSLTK